MPYQVQYALHPERADKALWVEDTGRWFAGADRKPERAHASSASSTSGTIRRSASLICRASTASRRE